MRQGKVLYNAVWSVANEHDQILGVWFVRCKGMKEVMEVHRNLQKRWVRAGEGGPELFYTDNADKDEAALVSALLPQ